MWGIWGSYLTTPKAIFDLLKGDYKSCSVDLSGGGYILALGSRGMKELKRKWKLP